MEGCVELELNVTGPIRHHGLMLKSPISMLPRLYKVTTMELNGKIIQLLPEQSGESAKGPWRKQEYILETEGQYPKKVCFMAWSDKINEFAIKEGENLVVSIDLESREYNGRWYTDVKAWKVTRGSTVADNFPISPPTGNNTKQPENLPPLDDVIPF
jgi:hypothetical protein